MLRKLRTRLFPICRTDVPRGSEGAVHCFRKWCGSQSQADAYARRLYKALDEFHWRHAARHGVYVPQLTASTMDVDVFGASGVGPGPLPTCKA